MDPKRAIVLQHVPFEGPARLGPMLEQAGCALDVRRLDQGAAVPHRLRPGEVLVVMGGPMGVEDLDHPDCPFLRPEVDLLARCIEADAPVLGVCLGAQLLAAAAGARVGPMTGSDGQRLYEVGWGPVRFDPGDPVLEGLPAETSVLHWHGDTFALPAGARRLASTPTCANQAFRLRARLFGLQFHCEAGADQVDDFLRADGPFVERALGPGGPDRIRRETPAQLAASRAAGDRFLQNILGAMLKGT